MSTAQSVISTPRAGTYTIDPQGSEIGFTTKHLFGTGKVEGTFSDVSGTIGAMVEGASGG
jgi:polyisoprenoid-binding protein YceI